MEDNFDSTMALLASDIPNVTVANLHLLPVDGGDEKEVPLGNSNQDVREKKLRGILKTVNSDSCTQKLLPDDRASNDKENYIDPSLPTRSPLKKVKSPFKKPNYASPLSKFPALVARLGIDDDGDDSTSSIVDVDNDQIFDNSIFTEYDDRDLSIMSEKISVKFRTVLKTDGKSRGIKSAAASTKIALKQFDETMMLLNESRFDKSPDEKSSLDDEKCDIEKVKKNLNFDGSTEIRDQEEKPLDDEIYTQDNEENELEHLEESFGCSENNSTRSERRCSTESTCSDWFNTTREEMILYEKFGEDYDVIVEKMTHEEKMQLKEEIAKAVPKEIHELLGSAAEEDVAREEDKANEPDQSKSSVQMVDETPNISQLSEKIVMAARTAQPVEEVEAPKPIPLPRTLTPQKKSNIETIIDTDKVHTPSKDSERLPEIFRSPKPLAVSLATRTQESRSPSHSDLSKRRYFKPLTIENSPSCPKPPTSSLTMTKTAGCSSPLKQDLLKRKYFKPPANEHSPSYLKHTTASRQRASPLKNCYSSPSHEPSSNFCTRGNYCSVSPSMQPRQTVLQGVAHKKCLVNMAKIVSPVGQYIQTSSVPKLMRNIKPKAAKYLEDEILAIQEQNSREVNENRGGEQPKKSYFKPLPEAEYRSSKVALEKDLPSESAKDLPRKFMTENSTEAVVVRHLGRKQVPQRDINNWAISSESRFTANQGGVRVKTNENYQDSEEMNATSVDMSIREVKKIQKLVPSLSRRQLY